MVAGLADDGLVTVFDDKRVSFFDKSRFKVLTPASAHGERCGNLYYLPEKASHHCLSSVSTSINHSLFDWHVILNHIGLKALKLTLKSLGIKPTLLDEIEVQQCSVCVRSKMSRLSFGSRSSHRASKPGEIIHTDVCSFECVSREGFSMWVTFIDDFSKNTSVYPLKSKTFQSFRHYRAAFEKQHSCSILNLVSDNGGEYMGNDFQEYLRDEGIRHEPGPPHSPQINGVAERTNRTLCDRLRCCLLGAEVPKSFWADALHHLVFVMNSIPCHTPSGFQSPNTVNDLPLVDAKYLHPFGCLVWYKVPEANRKKLDPKGRAALLLSYLANGNGYRVWDLETRTVVKSRDVIFRDDVFPYKRQIDRTHLIPLQVEVDWPLPSDLPTPVVPSPPAPRIGVFRSDRRLQASVHNPDNAPPPSRIPLPPSPTSTPSRSSPSLPTSPEPTPDPPSPPMPRRSSRVRKVPTRYGNRAKAAAALPTSDLDVPRTWKQVLRLPNKDKWLKAADDEYTSLVGMKTWRLVPRPLKRKIIRSKWVFKPKVRPDGSILKLKARLVAMGFSQEKGIDFDEVFAPTTRFETLRLILSLLGSKDWGGYQVDFTAAFLNGSLDEPVYMSQPPGYEDSEHPEWVCEVTNAIYGLKQSPRQWNKTLHALLTTLGLTQSKFDPTLYFKIRDGRLVCAVAVHVDDLAVVGEESIIQRLMDDLEKTYKVGQREELHHFLSLNITCDRANNLVYLSQSHYIRNVHAQFLPDDSITMKTPTSSAFKDLGPKTDSEDSSPGPYSSLVGALLWVAQSTRADISFSVNRLSQFLHNPSAAHWHAALRVLWYLHTTKDLRLCLGGGLEFCGYSDSDWAEDRFDRRSTSAYTYRIGCGSVSWKSWKQPTVSLSSTEAEYKAMLDSCKEAIWLGNVLSELCPRTRQPIPLHVYNKGAEALSRNPEHHTRTKHIDARYHFIREFVGLGKVKVKHVSTKDMIADMLTKPLPHALLVQHRRMFGIV